MVSSWYVNTSMWHMHSKDGYVSKYLIMWKNTRHIAALVAKN